MTKILLACCMVCLPLRHLRITSCYGFRVHPLTGRFSFHKGVDLRARSDTVFAVLSGKVISAAYDPLLGFYVRLSHGDFETIYGHLSQILVLAGDLVIAGDALGISGATGAVTGEHLHFGVCYRHSPVDPIKFLTLLTKQINQHKKENKP
jgi:murein DD-endopeptidase MepM/ murein hydrolase activator NlpD